MKVLENIEGVLFDLDKTLIDSTLSFEQLSHRTFDEFAQQLAPVTPDQFWQAFWPKAIDMWRMMVDRVIDGEQAWTSPWWVGGEVPSVLTEDRNGNGG